MRFPATDRGLQRRLLGGIVASTLAQIPSSVARIAGELISPPTACSSSSGSARTVGSEAVRTKIGVELDCASPLTQSRRSPHWPAGGTLPQAQASIADVAHHIFHINRSELIRHLPENGNDFTKMALADMLKQQNEEPQR